MPEIMLEIPLAEFERLHAQVRRLQEALAWAHPHAEPKPGCKACEALNAPDEVYRAPRP